MENLNKLQVVTVKTLPELIDRTEAVANAITERIAALNLETIEATEENVKRLVDLRATLNKELKLLEESRKQVKQQIMDPYERFEEVYNERIKKLYNESMALLDVETKKIYQARKDKAVAEAKKYYDELAKVYNLPEASFDYVKVEYSSTKKMKASIETYFEQLKGTLIIINNHEHSARLYTLWETYGRDLASAVSALNDQLLIEARRAQELEQIKNAQPDPDLILPVDEPVAPLKIIESDVEEEVEVEEALAFNLKVVCNQDELNALVEYLFLNNIYYEID